MQALYDKTFKVLMSTFSARSWFSIKLMSDFDFIYAGTHYHKVNLGVTFKDTR